MCFGDDLHNRCAKAECDILGLVGQFGREIFLEVMLLVYRN